MLPKAVTEAPNAGRFRRVGFCVAIFAASLAGCANQPEMVAPRVVPPANWFCSMATTEEWECVENEALDPSTRRSGQVARRTSPPADVPELIEELEREAKRERASEARTPAVDAPDTRAPNESRPTALAVERPREIATQTGAPTSTDSRDLQEPAIPAPAADVPLYRALAYRPDRAVRMLDLPAEYFAVQLLASASKENLERFASETRIEGLAAARIAADERLLYILLLGIYTSRDAAERAAASVPQETLGDVTPWVRSLGSLQRAMLAGDELAGTSEI